MLNQYEVTLSKYAFKQLDEIRQYYEFDLFYPMWLINCFLRAKMPCSR